VQPRGNVRAVGRDSLLAGAMPREPSCALRRVHDYGRVDLRLTETGEIYVIEVNASCYLEQSGESAQAAAAVGIDYVALVNHIAELALERHGRAAAVENGLKTHGGSGAAGAGRAPGPAGP